MNHIYNAVITFATYSYLFDRNPDSVHSILKTIADDVGLSDEPFVSVMVTEARNIFDAAFAEKATYSERDVDNAIANALDPSRNKNKSLTENEVCLVSLLASAIAIELTGDSRLPLLTSMAMPLPVSLVKDKVGVDCEILPTLEDIIEMSSDKYELIVQAEKVAELEASARKARQKRQEEARIKREAEAAQLEERRQAAIQTPCRESIVITKRRKVKGLNNEMPTFAYRHQTFAELF